ncbi:MAG: hypothetical protein M0D57_06570 [Sphingobacteriales bacterium JAD_PAG50586_3]|nr:MAG: hypothetical protein M0D57_06570 [Sphingobacteriales bacterium JAD_PAG50586_3]
MSADGVHFFACPKKRTKEKTPRPKTLQFCSRTCHAALVAMQNFVFTQGVDYPAHFLVSFTAFFTIVILDPTVSAAGGMQ